MTGVPSRQVRGNSYDRRRRREWLVEMYGYKDACGRTRVPCHHCKKPLTPSKVTVDRWPICGHDGGRYTRDNIRPACGRCNFGRCNNCPRTADA